MATASQFWRPLTGNNPPLQRGRDLSFQCQSGWNRFNAALDHQARLWCSINEHGGLQAICPGHKYVDPPWVKMPPQGRRYAKVGSLAYNAVLADGNDHLIPFTQGVGYANGGMLVPEGHDGCIVSVVFGYTGTGFNEGSGDLTWRIQINQRWAKDYSKVTTQIGSLQTPYNINSGQILLQTGNLVQVFVNISAGAAGNLAGGTILGAIFGWTWPR